MKDKNTKAGKTIKAKEVKIKQAIQSKNTTELQSETELEGEKFPIYISTRYFRSLTKPTNKINNIKKHTHKIISEDLEMQISNRSHLVE